MSVGPNTNPVRKALIFGMSDFYKDYGRAYRKQEVYPKRTYKQYKDYINAVLAEIFQKIIKDMWHFVLPFGMGEFYIKEQKHLAGKRVSYDSTYEGKAKISHTFNNHTFRKVFRFIWDKSYVSINNTKFIKFELLDGRESLHRRYNVGREAISKFYFSMNSDPTIKMIDPYNYPIKKLEEPVYESE